MIFELLCSLMFCQSVLILIRDLLLDMINSYSVLVSKASFENLSIKGYAFLLDIQKEHIKKDIRSFYWTYMDCFFNNPKFGYPIYTPIVLVMSGYNIIHHSKKLKLRIKY